MVTVTRNCVIVHLLVLLALYANILDLRPVNRDPPKPIVTGDQQSIVTLFLILKCSE